MNYSNKLHPYYLQQLGIQTWVQRQSYTPQKSLSELAKEVSVCVRCPLHATRKQTVFARGNPHASLMIVGEAPGFYEDQAGFPFVGKAGGLLNKMLHSIELSDNDVYIANVLKCRPPNNRDPKADEIQHCSGYLSEQITLIKPTLLLAVGRFAGQFLLKKPLPLNKMRHKVHDYNGTPVVVSYHPAYLLRYPADKKEAYRDLLFVKQLIKKNKFS